VTNPIGPLTAADERFDHQVVDTFAVVGTSDPAWTEKVCAMACARDGSLQLGFGLGKYTNRNVMDCYAGTSRGVEQITVRASRRLSDDLDLLGAGPIRYEVVEPMRQVRFTLEANDVQPIAFDWLFTAELPPTLEDRTHNRQVNRVSAELVRYHQIGVAEGWVEVDGERTQITPDSWVSTRDHSWGVRYDVGAPATDLEPSRGLDGGTFQFVWSPILMERPDGSRYGLFLNVSKMAFPGFEQKTTMAMVEHPDGRVDRIVDLEPELTYDPANRRLRGGRLHATLADGSTRTLEVEVVSDTGFHLGAGLYFGWDGHHHGEWRGPLNVEGERIADCGDPEQARRLHQIRDTVVRVTDPVGGGIGIGNMQPIVTGAFPELGLDADSSFI
jgi:hypothetical protein